MKDNEFKTEYGMLAYLRAEELARRIDNLSQKIRTCAAPVFTPVKYYKLLNKTLTAADTTYFKPLLRLSGTGAFTALFKLKVYSPAPVTASVSVNLGDGAVCASETVTFESGARDYILTGAGAADGEARRVALQIDGAPGRTLLSFDMSASGDGIGLTSSDAALKVVSVYGRAHIGYVSGNTAFYGSDGDAAFREFADADEFAYLGGMCVVRRGKKLDVLSSDLKQKYALSAAAESFAVLFDERTETFAAAYDEGGRALYREFTDGYVTEPVHIKTEFYVAECGAAVGANPPLLLLRDKAGAVYFKTARDMPSEERARFGSAVIEVF